MKSAPDGAELKGTFDVRISLDQAGSKVTVRRRIRAHLGRYEVARYPEVRAAFEAFRSIRDQAATFERDVGPATSAAPWGMVGSRGIRPRPVSEPTSSREQTAARRRAPL